MHSFRTVVKPDKTPYQITHKDKVMTVGSCFSENIGRYFERYKFAACINPFGQLYNPHSIVQALQRMTALLPYTTDELGHNNERYHSYDHHGSYSKATADETAAYINSELTTAGDFLKNATVLFLTLGTAHYFRLKESGKIVANCHKMPGGLFDFDLLQPSSIVDDLDNALKAVWRINPSLKIILTVSPVRYFAFGHFENSVSKGHLFNAIHTLLNEHPALYYFPAYELVMDDLRDYRFYAEDMLHPSQQATTYVWQALTGAMMTEQTRQLLKEIDGIIAATSHRPRNPNTEAHKKFVEATIYKMEKLEREQGLDFGVECEKMRHMV